MLATNECRTGGETGEPLKPDPLHCISRSDPRDATDLVSLLADAFEGDPFYDWLFPDGLARNRLIRTNIQLDLDFLSRRGTVLTNAARQLALGYRPPGSVLDPTELAAHRDAVLDAAEGSGERLRLARLAVAGEPDLRSISFLALSPLVQRTRPAISMLRHLYEHLVTEGVALFGHATSGQSLGLYRRAGADLYGAPIRLPLDGPVIYPVVWKPADTLPHYALHGP
jgi:hypothetical protein